MIERILTHPHFAPMLIYLGLAIFFLCLGEHEKRKGRRRP